MPTVASIADRGNADSIEAGYLMCEEDRETDHEHGEGATPEADGQTLNDVGGGAGFGGFRNIPDRPHRRVVFGDKTNRDAGHGAGQDGPEHGLAYSDRANGGRSRPRGRATRRAQAE